MKSYIAHVSSWKVFRALNIESNLARLLSFNFQLSFLGDIQLSCHCGASTFFSFQANSPNTHIYIVDFLESRRRGTAPTSIEVLLHPTLGQSDEPSDLRGSLNPTTRHRCKHVLVYTAPGKTRRSVPVTHPIMDRAQRCLASVNESTPTS